MEGYVIFNPKYTIDNIYRKFSIDDINNKPNTIIEYILNKDKSSIIKYLYCLSKISTSLKSKRLYISHLNKIEYLGVLLNTN